MLKPIVTVHASEGVTYALTTNYPTAVSSNQTAVQYKSVLPRRCLQIPLQKAVIHLQDGTRKQTEAARDIQDTQSVSFPPANDGERIVLYAQWTASGVVTVNSSENGTVTADKTQPKAGETVTLTVTPDAGYKLDSLTIMQGDIPVEVSDTFTFIMPAGDVTVTAVYAPNQYTVAFDTNGGEAIDAITVTYGEKYGRFPSSAITGLSGGDSNWYLVDADGNVTDTKITRLLKVTQTRDHTLFIKRKVLAPSVKLTLSVPGGISDNYQYYIPGNSMRILTATVSNKNDAVLNYTYQWYKDGSLIDGETGDTLTLAGNVADSGNYKVVVTATLKDDAEVPPVPEKDGYTGAWDHGGKNITADTVIRAVYIQDPVPSEPQTPQDPQNPQTGLNIHCGLWIALLVFCGCAVAVLTVIDRKKIKK